MRGDKPRMPGLRSLCVEQARRNAAAGAGAGGAAGGARESKADDANVVDAEFTEVKDKKG